MLNRRAFAASVASAAAALTFSFKRSDADELNVESKPLETTEVDDSFIFRNIDLHYFMGSLIALRGKLVKDPMFMQARNWSTNLSLYLENQIELLIESSNDLYQNPSFMSPNISVDHKTTIPQNTFQYETKLNPFAKRFVQELDLLLSGVSRMDSRHKSSGIDKNESSIIREHLNKIYTVLAAASSNSPWQDTDKVKVEGLKS